MRSPRYGSHQVSVASRSVNVSLLTRPRTAAMNRGFATAFSAIITTDSVCSASASRTSAAASRARRAASSATRRSRAPIIARSASGGTQRMAPASASPPTVRIHLLRPPRPMAQ